MKDMILSMRFHTRYNTLFKWNIFILSPVRDICVFSYQIDRTWTFLIIFPTSIYALFTWSSFAVSSRIWIVSILEECYLIFGHPVDRYNDVNKSQHKVVLFYVCKWMNMNLEVKIGVSETERLIVDLEF